MAPKSNLESVINSNPQLQTYYHSLESRIGYRLLLGGTRHFGFYKNDTRWPFPLSKALRAMEDKLAACLNLPPGSHVLDAGCGVGNVAYHLASNYGFKIQGIDVVDHHLTKAKRNIARRGLTERQSTMRKMDYHHIENLGTQTFDGAYTMETFVHATDPKAVWQGSFARFVREAGSLCSSMTMSLSTGHQATCVSNPGVFQRMLEDAGFTDVVVRDFSDNIKPMTRLFCWLVYVPYLLVTLVGLERHFINTVAGVQSYRGRKHWRYLGISATKPKPSVEIEKARALLSVSAEQYSESD